MYARSLFRSRFPVPCSLLAAAGPITNMRKLSPIIRIAPDKNTPTRVSAQGAQRGGGRKHEHLAHLPLTHPNQRYYRDTLRARRLLRTEMLVEPAQNPAQPFGPVLRPTALSLNRSSSLIGRFLAMASPDQGADGRPAAPPASRRRDAEATRRLHDTQHAERLAVLPTCGDTGRSDV